MDREKEIAQEIMDFSKSKMNELGLDMLVSTHMAAMCAFARGIYGENFLEYIRATLDELEEKMNIKGGL